MLPTTLQVTYRFRFKLHRSGPGSVSGYTAPDHAALGGHVATTLPAWLRRGPSPCGISPWLDECGTAAPLHRRTTSTPA